jgi:hypothetical protein
MIFPPCTDYFTTSALWYESTDLAILEQAPPPIAFAVSLDVSIFRHRASNTLSLKALFWGLSTRTVFVVMP